VEVGMALSMRELEKLFMVKPGHRLRLKDKDAAWSGSQEFKHLAGEQLKEKAQAIVNDHLQRLSEAQEHLYANDVYSVLVVLQAMDAAGKDGIIKHVMSGLNPQGCEVFSFKKPSDEELDHNYLWRYSRNLPERGRIGIFNRSYYEETLVVRVHPEILEREKLPPGKRGKKFWADRYDDINRFERHLARNGTLIVKLFLHMSKKEQLKRFLARLDTPEKQWKFSMADLQERAFWKEYQEAFEDTISHTSTRSAPWWVIPADNKWVARAVVSAILGHAIKGLGLGEPKLSAEQKAVLAKARRRLEEERG
jgi:PPK2 family polyphosphate:nucleotide phosphotransferase